MPLYEYRAYDAAGRLLKGLIDAPSERSAHDKVKERGLFPSAVTEDTGETGIRRGASGETLAFTMIQIATLLRAGMPLPAALESVSSQVTVPALQRALVRSRVRLSEGKNLAEAMADETVFPPLLIRLVEAGNTVGELENILERFAQFTERQDEMRRKLVGAITYPATVLVASIALVIFMLTYVAPTITGIYAGLGKDLPLPTMIMMGAGTFLETYAVWLVLAACLLVLAWWRLVPRRFKDTLALRTPFFGNLLTLSAAGRWCRTLAMLHAGGVPLQRALKGAREVLDNVVLMDDMGVVEQQVETGSGLAAALRKVWRMPPLVAQMAETGERSGALEGLMNSAAEFYEKDLDRRIAQFFRLMEPAMIFGIGIIVGFVVVSIMLPIIQMNQLM
ncbi:MAG TPA: type II secretion system F family protein [Candidatus Xenobia bacterium]|jgi:general secretion pathway protein F